MVGILTTLIVACKAICGVIEVVLVFSFIAGVVAFHPFSCYEYRNKLEH
jgi:hypothetical protein